MKIYELVKEILVNDSSCRNSDKKLIWAVWEKLELLSMHDPSDERPMVDKDGNWIYCLLKEHFMEAPSTETIRRCRQKIQEENIELRSSKKVRQLRAEKQKSKGTFVYHEEIKEQQTLL